ncbi:hypothetical protein DES49_0549 [Halospina denitrificans]|uniref:Uncharacterized protein n=1 Tax=Halospina denitrificans TaxID=332522 RepID=A0A4R7K1J6_9GAMM|nr:hypothetical protein DES49_0549 [Halospina denitrificans]
MLEQFWKAYAGDYDFRFKAHRGIIFIRNGWASPTVD